MKHDVYFLLILVSLLLSCSNSKDQKPATTDQKPGTAGRVSKDETVPSSIEAIQKKYEEINSQKTEGFLDSTGFKYNCNNETSGTVSYFTYDGQLRFILHQYNEYDHHEAEDFYYVSDSSLFFVYKKQILWSFESGPQAATRDNFTEQRVYILNGIQFRCLEKKYVVRSHATNNPIPDTIPNKEINCAAVDVLKPYQQLMKHRGKAPSGCL